MSSRTTLTPLDGWSSIESAWLVETTSYWGKLVCWFAAATRCDNETCSDIRFAERKFWDLGVFLGVIGGMLAGGKGSWELVVTEKVLVGYDNCLSFVWFLSLKLGFLFFWFKWKSSLWLFKVYFFIISS